jgi:hypothetical protein
MTQKIRPRHPEKVKNPINPIKKKPDWIRSKLSNSKEFFLTKTIVNKNNLVTVCQEANCPNITECWSKRHATFMIMGDTCTRACAFCDVKTGKPVKLDEFEPIKISQAVKKLNKYTARKARAGEMFSVMEKGAPAAVKATVVYNDLLRFWGLHKKHASISQGDKVKWIYLKQNPYQVSAIAFLEWDLPEKMHTFIEQYADRKKIFESILLNKLEGFYNDLGWTLNLNPYQQMFFNI